jgi:hypothetical protein
LYIFLPHRFQHFSIFVDPNKVVVLFIILVISRSLIDKEGVWCPKLVNHPVIARHDQLIKIRIVLGKLYKVETGIGPKLPEIHVCFKAL